SLAYAVERKLFDLGKTGFVLDGGNVRSGLSRDLTFTGDDRAENSRRTAESAKLLCDAGLVVMCALISPFEQDREGARGIVGAERFIEIYLSTPLEVCRQRTAGVYEQADAGEFDAFTGVSAPYEPPAKPD